MDPVSLRDAKALDAWQPMEKLLVSCYIFEKTMFKEEWAITPMVGKKYIPSGYSESLVEVWEPRTYFIFKKDGVWNLDVGEGGYFKFEEWDHIVSWFEKMHPLFIEVMIDD